MRLLSAEEVAAVAKTAVFSSQERVLSFLRGSCGARVSEVSEFFLDDYRESPLEYRPSQTLMLCWRGSAH